METSPQAAFQATGRLHACSSASYLFVSVSLSFSLCVSLREQLLVHVHIS